MRRYSHNAISVLKKRETETWIYSYADLITNLLALFVMLLVVMTGSKSVQHDLQKGIEKYAKVTGPASASGRAAALDELRQMLSKLIEGSGLAGQIALERTRNGVALTFESALLFESATAQLNEEALAVLSQVASLLAAMPPPFVVDVEGHADRRPITSGRYPSNWELSSARAGSVVRVLESQGVASSRLRAIGFAATRPLDGTGEGDENRRVVIKVNSESQKE